MKKPVDCPFFYANYHRGLDIEKCRLVERNPENARPWHRSLCNSCPVPRMLRQTTSRNLLVEGSVVRKFGLLDRVSVYAVCGEHLVELADPLHCPACEAEARGARSDPDDVPCPA